MSLARVCVYSLEQGISVSIHVFHWPKIPSFICDLASGESGDYPRSLDRRGQSLGTSRESNKALRTRGSGRDAVFPRSGYGSRTAGQIGR